MSRVKCGVTTRKRHRKIMKLAEGYIGGRRRLFRTANEAVMKAGKNAYIGRKQRKRQFRQLWITRISAAARMNGLSYSVFINKLKQKNLGLNRKVLSEIAVVDFESFQKLCDELKLA